MALPAILDAVERALQTVMEQGPLRAFRARVEPVHVVRAVERAMSRHELVSARGVLVPSSYTVRLHPTDLERFQAMAQALVAELEARVAESARLRGRILLATPSITIHADACLPRGRVVAEARETISPAEEQPDELPATSKLPLIPPSVSISLDVPGLGVVTYAKPVVSIGRGAENDVVLSDPLVSRKHAEVRLTARGAELCDLESTNGTWVRGQRVRTLPIVGEMMARFGSTDIPIRGPLA